MCVKLALYINPLTMKPKLFYLKTQFVPRSEHVSFRSYKPTSLCYVRQKLLFVLRSVQNTYTQCGHHVELLNVNTGGTSTNQQTLQG
jgi:hypothetical protein